MSEKCPVDDSKLSIVVVNLAVSNVFSFLMKMAGALIQNFAM